MNPKLVLGRFCPRLEFGLDDEGREESFAKASDRCDKDDIDLGFSLDASITEVDSDAGDVLVATLSGGRERLLLPWDRHISPDVDGRWTLIAEAGREDAPELPALKLVPGREGVATETGGRGFS